MKQVETIREAMINRRSVRKYKTDMIPRDIIERIVEAGTYAANGRGHQASIILAVTNKELRDKLSEMNRKIGGWDEGIIPFLLEITKNPLFARNSGLYGQFKVRLIQMTALIFR